ncbi:hypothetical protein QFC21_003205 [Naganishia friedmannii]|uniref:Uncharacterized protein n=1 Tax=Naganishia friedmannii TaxID=89922 RepID=A0ACC2VSI3_9TREE|nr:hypothetical protein QFC21_003205 [Naganishia friedmannii]
MPSGASATRSKAGRKRISNTPKPRRTSSSSSRTAATSSTSSTSNNGEKYADNHWFWLLTFAIPAGFARCFAVIETFEAYFRDKKALGPVVSLPRRPWNHPFATFLHLACELLLPVTAFGGFGGGNTLAFWGERLSRNQIIGKILTKATGFTYDHKHVSSHKQTIIKNLLSRYIDAPLGSDERGCIAEALQQLAGRTSLERFLRSYLRSTDSEKKRTRTQLKFERAAKALVEEQRPDILRFPEAWCRFHNAIALHPILAFFLGLSGNSIVNAASTETFLRADQPLQAEQAIPKFGVDWWNNFVMTDADRKAQYMELWWQNEDLGDDALSEEEFHRIHGQAPNRDRGAGLAQGPGATVGT